MKKSPLSKTVKVKVTREGSSCLLPVPFDPKAVFGKVRAPVKVTINGYTYRSTIAVMGGEVCLPLRRSHREAAGLVGGETLPMTLELDTEAREVAVPRELAAALKASPPAWERWMELSYTHQREHAESIEQARRPETRARRLEKTVRDVAARPPRNRKQPARS